MKTKNEFFPSKSHSQNRKRYRTRFSLFLLACVQRMMTERKRVQIEHRRSDKAHAFPYR